MLKHRRLNLLLVLALVALLVVPAFNATQAQGAKKLVYNTLGKGDLPTADPALVEDTSSHQVVIETHYPLVQGLETDLSKIMPGMAESWKVSDDNLTYTLTIRKNVSWVKWDPDGKQVVQVKDDKGAPLMVTAKDFEYGILRTLDPATASPYASSLTDFLGIAGAKEYNTSKETGDALDKLRSAVGVKATDDNTLVIKVNAAQAFNLGLMTLPNLAAQAKADIDKFGAKWTEPGNAWSYGPFVMSEWKHDESLTLVKNPFWAGFENAPKPMIDEIVMPMLDESPGFANYEAGTADIATAPVAELDRIKADATLSKELQIGPIFCTYYYSFNLTKPPTNNAHFRRALSYALDRQSIIDNVAKANQEPARWMARPGLAAAPTLQDSPKLGIGYDPEAAKQELKAYLDEAKTTVDQLPTIVMMTNQTEGHVAIAQAAIQMWQKTLGIKVQQQQQEWKVFLDTLKSEAPQIYRLGWCQDYADASNFLKDVWHTGASQNYAKWSNAEFDKLVDDAAKIFDNNKRLEMYRQAEDILNVKDAAMIPIYWYTRATLTKPYVVRTFSSGSGDERMEKWDVKAH